MKGGRKICQPNVNEMSVSSRFFSGGSFLMGCALGVTRVNVSHDPLNRIENKRGNILVNEFKDVRLRKGNISEISEICM